MGWVAQPFPPPPRGGGAGGGASRLPAAGGGGGWGVGAFVRIPRAYLANRIRSTHD
nr:MAG TPA: Transcription initiation factor TFIID subunit, DNA, Nuclear [Caudoviricetes sp.]